MSDMLRIGACVLAGLIHAGPVLAQTGTHDGFELVRKEQDILVFERWVTFPGSVPSVTAREVKSEFYVSGKVREALKLVQDETRITDWQKHVSEFRVYPHSDSLWFEYSYHDIPWPVSDQDHFLEYRIEAPARSSGTFITFRTVQNDSLAPVRKGVSRMTLAGSWYLQQENGRVKVTYRILSMPGNLPRFITDPVIRTNLMTTVKEYIRLLETQ